MFVRSVNNLVYLCILKYVSSPCGVVIPRILVERNRAILHAKFDSSVGLTVCGQKIFKDSLLCFYVKSKIPYHRSLFHCRVIIFRNLAHSLKPYQILKIKALTHSPTMTPFDAPGKQAFSKHYGKRRNCLLRAISPFPTVFSTFLDNFLPFSPNVKLSSANFFSLEESKICRLVVG